MISDNSLPLGGLVTAAGLSSRMGEFKALLPFGSGSIISSCVDNMSLAGAEPIVVVTGHRAAEIEEHLDGRNCIFIHNPNYMDNQMFDSLCLGLRELSGRCVKVLISPLDVPAVKVETIRTLLSVEADFVRPSFRGKAGHPVVLDAALIPAILSYGGEGGLRGAVEELKIKVMDVECEDEGVSIDVDRPEDYERIKRLREIK